MKRHLGLAVATSVGIAVTGCVTKSTTNTPQPQISSREIYELANKTCTEKGGWTYDINKCIEEETYTAAGSPPKPEERAEWNDSDQKWVCPTSNNTSKYYRDCSVGNIPSTAERALNKKIEDCTSRANKTEDSPGWYWAERLCKKNTNAF
jgi:hypothetical protein